MNLTKQQCEAFRTNPKVNPLTGRSIEVGKIRHQQLTEACGKNSSPKKSPSPKNQEAPPMGPMIHWEYNVVGQLTDEVIRKNVIAFMNHIHDRLKELQSSAAVSEMELRDMADLLKNFEAWLKVTPGLKNKDKLLKGVEQELEHIKTVYKEQPILKDQPTEKEVAEIPIKHSRCFIRGRVLRGYLLYKDALVSIRESLQEGHILTMVVLGQIKDVLRYKTYCDYLIKHKIFSHDDIYKRTYPGDDAFEDLKAKYTEYRKLYKKEKGASPGGKWPL
jgi:2-cysteine adaptor domain